MDRLQGQDSVELISLGRNSVTQFLIWIDLREVWDALELQTL